MRLAVAAFGLGVLNAEFGGLQEYMLEYEEATDYEYFNYETEEAEESEDLCKFRSLAERGSVFFTARSYNARDRENGQKIFDEILEDISRINEGRNLDCDLKLFPCSYVQFPKNEEACQLVRRLESLTEYISNRCPSVTFGDLTALKASSEPMERPCLSSSEFLDDGELRQMNSAFRIEFAAPIRDVLTEATAKYRQMLDNFRTHRKQNDIRKERYHGFIEEKSELARIGSIGKGMLGDVGISTESWIPKDEEDFDVKFYLQSLEERNAELEAKAKQFARSQFETSNGGSWQKSDTAVKRVAAVSSSGFSPAQESSRNVASSRFRGSFSNFPMKHGKSVSILVLATKAPAPEPTKPVWDVIEDGTTTVTEAWTTTTWAANTDKPSPSSTTSTTTTTTTTTSTTTTTTTTSTTTTTTTAKSTTTTTTTTTTTSASSTSTTEFEPSFEFCPPLPYYPENWQCRGEDKDGFAFTKNTVCESSCAKFKTKCVCKKGKTCGWQKEKDFPECAFTTADPNVSTTVQTTTTPQREVCPPLPYENQEGLWDCKKDANIDRQTCKITCPSKKYRASCQCRKGSCKWNWSGKLDGGGSIIFPSECESLISGTTTTGPNTIPTTTSTTQTVTAPASCAALEEQDHWSCSMESNLNKQKCSFDCESRGKFRKYTAECKCKNGKCSWKGKTSLQKCENLSSTNDTSNVGITTTTPNLAITTVTSSETCAALPEEIQHFKCSKMDGNNFVHNSLCKGRCSGRMKRITCSCQNQICEWSDIDPICLL